MHMNERNHTTPEHTGYTGDTRRLLHTGLVAPLLLLVVLLLAACGATGQNNENLDATAEVGAEAGAEEVETVVGNVADDVTDESDTSAEPVTSTDEMTNAGDLVVESAEMVESAVPLEEAPTTTTATTDTTTATITATGEANPQPDPTALRITMHGEVTSMSDIRSNSNTYLGKPVKVQGFVNDLIGSRAFLLGATTNETDENMLVLLNDDDKVITENTTKYVVGNVRTFDSASLEAMYGFDLDEALYADYEGQLVLVAYRTWSVPGTAVNDVALSDIAAEPTAFDGVDVNVIGQVQEHRSPNAVLVNQDGMLEPQNQVLVVTDNPDAIADLDTQTDIQIVGTVDFLTESAITMYGDVEIPAELYDDYGEERPIILATIIEPL